MEKEVVGPGYLMWLNVICPPRGGCSVCDLIGENRITIGYWLVKARCLVDSI